ARVGSPGPGTTTGYAFTWDRGSSATSGDVDMSRIDGEVPTGFESGADHIHLVPGNTYRLVFIGQGAAMEGRVYQLPDTTTPVVVVTGSDPNYTSGQVGLVTFDNSGVSKKDITFDNFLPADVQPPRIQVTQVFPGLFQLSWPAVPDEWGLQSSPKLPSASGDWVDETDVERFGDLTIFNIETGPTGTIVPPRFYRLKKKQ